MSNSEQIDAFLCFLRECEQRCHMAEADEQDANSATQDILHNIELREHGYHEYAALSKQLRDVRRKRRTAKDTMAFCTPILSWAEANRSVVKGLERLLGDVRKAERSAEGRIYTPRTKR